MPRTYPLHISLEEIAEDAVDQIAGEIEEAVENIRKYQGGAVSHTEDVDIDELLAEHGAAAVIWTADDIRKIVPHLSDDEALAVMADCFRIFNPDETANREMIFQTAERLYPTLSWEQRSQRADWAIIAVISDRNGDHLATSRHFWIPEAKDPSSPTLNAMRVMAAAPKLLAALQGLLDATGSLPSTIMQGLFNDALYAANAAIAETEAPAFEHGP